MKERLWRSYAPVIQSLMGGLTHHNLNHHAAIRTGKARCTCGIDNLRDKGTVQTIEGANGPKKIDNVRHKEHRHSHCSEIRKLARDREDNHTIWRSRNTGQAKALRKKKTVHDMPSSILSSRPRATAGSACTPSVMIDLERATHLRGK